MAYHLLISPSAGNGKHLGLLWHHPTPASHQGKEQTQVLLPCQKGRRSFHITHSNARNAAAPTQGGKPQVSGQHVA